MNSVRLEISKFVTSYELYSVHISLEKEKAY